MPSADLKREMDRTSALLGGYRPFPAEHLVAIFEANIAAIKNFIYSFDDERELLAEKISSLSEHLTDAEREEAAKNLSAIATQIAGMWESVASMEATKRSVAPMIGSIARRQWEKKSWWQRRKLNESAWTQMRTLELLEEGKKIAAGTIPANPGWHHWGM